jgi:hypothetical protein
VKLPVPEPVLVEEVVGCGELVECSVAGVEGATAEWVCVCEADGVEDDWGVPVYADVGAAPGVVATVTDGVVDEVDVDPLAAHALRPAPPITTAMITAGTRHILIAPTSGE